VVIDSAKITTIIFRTFFQTRFEQKLKNLSLCVEIFTHSSEGWPLFSVRLFLCRWWIQFIQQGLS